MVSSSDGGRHWTRQDFTPVPERTRGISFADPGRGCGAGEADYVVTTADGGKTWTVQHTGIAHHLVGVAC